MNNSNDLAPQSDFLKILPDLWGGRRLIGVAMLVAAVACGVLSGFMSKTFESDTALLLMPPPFKEGKDGINDLIPKVLSVADYEIVLHSDGVLMAAAAKVKKEAPDRPGLWSEKDLAALDELSSMRKRLYITTEVTEKNVTSMKYSPVIVLTARASSPGQAQHLARAWAEVSVETAQSLYVKGKSGVIEFVETSFESARKELLDVSLKIREVEIEYNDELENTRMTKTYQRLIDYEENLLDNEVKLQRVKQEIASLEESFATQKQTLTIWKSPPMESIFLRKDLGAAASGAGRVAGDDSNLRLGYEEEVINQIYFDLQSKLIGMRTELAGLEETRRQLTEAVDALTIELQDMRREIAVRSYERRLLDMQISPRKNAYDLLATKLEQAKIIESEMSSSADIKVISEAQLPDKKSFPPRSLIVIGAAVFAGMAATAFVITRGLLRRAGLDLNG